MVGDYSPLRAHGARDAMVFPLWGIKAIRRLGIGLMLGEPPPLPPSPFSPVPPPPPPPRDSRRDFLIGLGCGLIPLVVSMVGLAATINVGAPYNAPPVANGALGVLLPIGAVLYLAEIIVMIVFLSMSQFRRIGYGLLTMVLVSPVVFFVGCIAMFIVPRQPPL